MSAVRTVLGDVPPAELGVCDAHDQQGGGAVVQWTPYGLGRRAADLPPLSRETGVHVVAATGLHQAASGRRGCGRGSSRSRAVSTPWTRTPAGP
ncbi:putative metal-dependent phosphotriesterase family hydrolase [Streptomyces africanus]|uniref:Metal-dependent phosphotriesterase family hydrolase n=1 Tax=Streptomyces africanus TaxID=231024 RepID=A0ABU0QGJ6_9ACTN|nr:putative metal-dependent phosphotriesterase family hydrolase [Streptomyces africanus]